MAPSWFTKNTFDKTRKCASIVLFGDEPLGINDFRRCTQPQTADDRAACIGRMQRDFLHRRHFFLRLTVEKK